MLPLKVIRLSGKREAPVGSYMIFLFLSLETGTHHVALAGLELRDPPASAPLMLGLKKHVPHHAQLLQDSWSLGTTDRQSSKNVF